MPHFIFNSPDSVRLNFIAGLIDTDGTVDKNGSISITSKDMQFMCDLSSLCGSMGFFSRVEPRFNKKYNKYYFTLRMQKEINQVLSPLLGYIKKAQRATSLKVKQKIKENSLMFVHPTGAYTSMLDIEVSDKEHCFFANGLLTKNSVNFGKNYGAGPKTIANTLLEPLIWEEMPDGKMVGKAPPHIVEYCEKYDELYAGVIEYRKQMSDIAYLQGYVESFLGKRRYVDVRGLKDKVATISERCRRGYTERKYKRHLWTADKEQHLQELIKKKTKAVIELYHAERVAGNTPIQSTAADIIKQAMVDIYAWLTKENLHDKVKIIMQVHDELVFYVHESIMDYANEKIDYYMINAVKLSLPINVSGAYGDNWGECK